MEAGTKRSWLNLVKSYFPQADDETCELILWELTPFPCAPRYALENRLEELKEEVSGYSNMSLPEILGELM